ncbi:MAG: preprotein translocase subunit YajC [Ornithinimicrobium sp.]|uniref:preprotein translocase subunit YajC n=1 Tax=Ornithinimicrobium sp. TaxID=1977084 RepID=UPI0026E02D21|nr:preprotein translocase subunit YajC [Ornithinimicrobium sp.]MDO5740994.1 preprotein translocase subunit YajC [Ornithinimicrobium sp.]
MTPLAAAAPASNSGSLSLFILGLPLLLLLWLMLSQRRRAKAARDAQAGLTVGQDVMVAAGLYGTVTGLDGDLVLLEIAEGVVVRVNRRSIIPQPEAAGADAQPRGGSSTTSADLPGEPA